MQGQMFAIHHARDGTPDFIIPLTLDLAEEDGNWVGSCLELGTSTFADSLQEVQAELTEAISLQLNETEKLGFLRDYLQEHNVHVISFPSPSQENLPGFAVTGVR